VEKEVKSKMDTVLLSKSDIEQLITMKEVVEIVDKTYKELSEGKVINLRN